MDWGPIIELGKVGGGVFVALTAIWKLIPRGWLWVKNCMMSGIQHQINQMSADISFIAAELKTNGGSSLRDSVISTEETLGRIEAMTWSNNEIQRARMDNDAEMIFITDKEGHCTWINRSYARHTGRAFKEVEGSGWINAIHPDHRASVVKAWYSAARHDREFEKTIVFLDTAGISFNVDIRSYKKTSADGHTIGFMGVGEVVHAE